MKHEEFSEMMILSLYGELSDEEDARLKTHLSDCLACRKERDELGEFHSTLFHASSETPEHLLWQARDALFLKLRRDSHAAQSRQRWAGVLGMMRWNWAAAGASLALLSVGFFVGYLSSGDGVNAGLDPFSSDEVRITNLQLEKTGESDGEIQISFEAARNFRLRGNIEDQKIHRFLAHALINEQNPGIRLRAVNTISDQSPVSNDKHVLEALIVALRRDENPAVRQQALKALQGYPFGEEIRDALVYVLMNDQNVKLRIEAINTLEMAHMAGAQFEQEVLGVLQQKWQTDENKFIRLRAKAVLEEIEPQFF